LCIKCRETVKKRNKKRIANNKCVCGVDLDGPSTICRKCRSKRSNAQRIERSKKYSLGLCICGRKLVDGLKSCKICLDRIKKKDKFYKDSVFKAYGGYMCVCCGETEPVFLCIDHTNNDGYKHRREIFGSNRIGGSRMYKWLVKNNFPPGFQVLCCNCNTAKRFGVCPHKTNEGK
jgi:hypothetical protein